MGPSGKCILEFHRTFRWLPCSPERPRGYGDIQEQFVHLTLSPQPPDLASAAGRPVPLVFSPGGREATRTHDPLLTLPTAH